MHRRTISLGQLLGAAVVLAPAAVLSRPTGAVQADVVVALLALAAFSTALAWPLRFRLLASIGPTASSTVTVLAPAFGIAWGAIALGEHLGPSLVFGAGLILASVGLIAGLGCRIPLGRFVDMLWTDRRSSRAEVRLRG